MLEKVDKRKHKISIDQYFYLIKLKYHIDG